MTSLGQPNRRALGRGLAALISSAPAMADGALRNLAIDEVQPNPQQPRFDIDADKLEELAASIRSHGVLQPIIVRKMGSGFEIVAGERRWRAAAKAGLTEIPALIKELSNAAGFEAALIENVQRADLDAMEEAHAYHRLVDDYGYSQGRVAEAVGKSRAAVANSMRLLRLPARIKTLLNERALTPGHARALMTVGDDTQAIRLGEEAAKNKRSVRELEARCRKVARARKPAQVAPASAAVLDVERRLTQALSTKVRVHMRGKRGRFEVFFFDLDGLDALLQRIGA
jgi:ParB family chromosome partitioning protein